MSRIRIALVGVGKIAVDQHLPTLAQSAEFALVALVSPSIHQQTDILARFPQAMACHSLDALLTSGVDVDAVALCVPAAARYGLAVQALEAGLDVLLEKPPGRGVAEVLGLARIAERHGRVLHASWHSRHAPQVASACRWLADKTPTSLTIDWHEDVRYWHPGQDWVWQPGGMGVFDPGINAFSIATLLLPQGFFFTRAQLFIPHNRQQPIAATLAGALSGPEGGPVSVSLDWLKTGDPCWEIRIVTRQGELVLKQGGAHLEIDGQPADGAAAQHEYAGLYAHFADLVRRGVSDVDTRPLMLVSDALLMGERQQAAAFDW